MIVLAKGLAKLTRKYQGEPWPFTQLSALLDEHDEQQLRMILDPQLVARLSGPFASAAMAAQLALPDLPELLQRFARVVAAGGHEGRAPLRKIGAKTAFRTYIIRGLADQFLSSTDELPSTVIATIVAVGLEDAAVTPDLVRKLTKDLVVQHRDHEREPMAATVPKPPGQTAASQLPANAGGQRSKETADRRALKRGSSTSATHGRRRS